MTGKFNKNEINVCIRTVNSSNNYIVSVSNSHNIMLYVHYKCIYEEQQTIPVD